MTLALWALLIVGLFGFVVFFGSPYVPSLRGDVRRVFSKLYPLSSRDVLVDLGSGDGVILRAASRYGARAVGVELNPLLVWLSRLLSLRYANVSVHTANLRSFKLPPDVTVVYWFGNSRDVARTTRYLLGETNRLNRTFHVISYGTQLPSLKLVKQQGACHLYETSLQPSKPQV